MIQVGPRDREEITPEEAIDRLIAAKAEAIAPETVLDALRLVPEPAPEAREKLLNRIVRELESHEDLLAVAPGKRYVPAARVFAGAEFLVTPDGWEIEQGILVPGHRFAPFMHRDVFPSEAVIRERGARRKTTQKSIRAHAETLLHYHLFMGAESLFDFFVAEDGANEAAARASGNPELTLAVWDMAEFYRETSFGEGDALLFHADDFASGQFTFQLDNGRERTDARRKPFRERFERALEPVLEGAGEGKPILEQIQLTLAADRELLRRPALSLDELILHDSPAEIVFDHDLSTLVWGAGEDGDEPDSVAAGIPDGVTISAGETGSLEAMLAALKCALTVTEIDAFMLDCCKNFDYDFNSFYSRAFGEGRLDFADAAQEAVFFNFLEERFEHWRDHYPREFDEQSGHLRAEILEFLMERQEVFDEFSGMEAGPRSDPAVYRELAEAVIALNEILKLLNHPEALPDDFDYAALHEQVDRYLDAGAEALARFRRMFEES